LKAAQKAGNHPEDVSTLPRAVAVVQSHLATQWTIQVNLFILAKLLYGSEVAVNAMQCSGFVRTATADSVIAVHSAASRHAGNRGTSRSSRSAARVSASSQASPGRRDGSGFRFDLFAAQYSFMGIEIGYYRHQQSPGSRFCVHASVAGVAEGVGPTASALSSLYPVWPAWSFRRSVSQDPTILGCRNDKR
jgi:hypothetical protein